MVVNLGRKIVYKFIVLDSVSKDLEPFVKAMYIKHVKLEPFWQREILCSLL